MSYTPTEWKAGDIVTAEKLNKIEDGISKSLYCINGSYDSSSVVLDKTYAEVQQLITDGYMPYILFTEGSYVMPCFLTYYSNTEIQFSSVYFDNSNPYVVIFASNSDPTWRRAS